MTRRLPMWLMWLFLAVSFACNSNPVEFSVAPDHYLLGTWYVPDAFGETFIASDTGAVYLTQCGVSQFPPILVPDSLQFRAVGVVAGPPDDTADTIAGRVAGNRLIVDISGVLGGVDTLVPGVSPPGGPHITCPY